MRLTLRWYLLLILLVAVTSTFSCLHWFCPECTSLENGHDDSILKTFTERRESRTYKEIQKNNYINGTGIILNIHLTHHAGTAFCRKMKGVGPVPVKWCDEPDNEQIQELSINMTAYEPAKAKYRPWRHDTTSQNIAIVRKYFHVISWEWGGSIKPFPIPSLHHSTNWEDPNLVSVMIIRHPISRLLAKSSYAFQLNLKTRKGWDTYIHHNRNPKIDDTNNFQLRRLSDDPGKCCQGNETSRSHLEAAKKLLQRFTFVIDIACLDDGLEAIARELGFKLRTDVEKEKQMVNLPGYKLPQNIQVQQFTNLPYRERVGFDDIYEFLLDHNKLDIELYEWAQTNLAIVKCGELNTTR